MVFQIAVHPQERTVYLLLWDLKHITGIPILRMRRTGEHESPTGFFPSETGAALSADESATQRRRLCRILNMILTSELEQLLNCFIGLAVYNRRMDIGCVILIPLPPCFVGTVWAAYPS